MNDSSDSPDAATAGRVRRLRKLRGLTQEQLARAAGVSVRTVKDVEDPGTEGRHRNETMHKLATGLQARTSDLTSPGQPEPQLLPAEPWKDVRDALYQRTAGPQDEEPPTPRGVLTALAAMRPDWEAGRYSRARRMLPGLVRDALALGADPAERAAKSAALSATAWLLTMTRQFADAHAAAALALDAAPEMPDGIAAVSMMTWCLLRQGRTVEAGALAAKWADDSEPRFSRATTGELAGYGKMLLYVANAAVTDNRPGDAADALSLAGAAAARLGRDVPFHRATTARFGPATVQVIAAESAALNWQPDEVLEIAAQVAPALGGIEPAQQLRHQLDVASARAMRKEYGDVVEVMQALRRRAPEWLASQQYARNVLEDVLRRRRHPLTGELRDLAAAVHLPV